MSPKGSYKSPSVWAAAALALYPWDF